ncbi:MAG TPA: YqcC family protein [Chitinophagaceae bacterium]|nr:YqcC family protein [Chitinophagaceae bacterium]
MTITTMIAQKIDEIKDEMRKAGTWKKEMPEWVKDFEKRQIDNSDDFSEWLQFVYLPNLLHTSRSVITTDERKFIAPQAIRYFGDDLKKGKLLQLLIELDSL